MQVALLLEYRKPPVHTGKRYIPQKWHAFGVVQAPNSMHPTEVLDNVREQCPQLEGYELVVRNFCPLPGPRFKGETGNVLVIEPPPLDLE